MTPQKKDNGKTSFSVQLENNDYDQMASNATNCDHKITDYFRLILKRELKSPIVMNRLIKAMK